jgi:hypothetical protein
MGAVFETRCFPSHPHEWFGFFRTCRCVHYIAKYDILSNRILPFRPPRGNSRSLGFAFNSPTVFAERLGLFPCGPLGAALYIRLCHHRISATGGTERATVCALWLPQRPRRFSMHDEASRGPGCTGVLLCTSKHHGPKGNEVRREKRPAALTRGRVGFAHHFPTLRHPFAHHMHTPPTPFPI